LTTSATRDGLAGLLRRIAPEVRPYWRTVTGLGVAAVPWAVWVSGPSPATPAFVVAALSGAALGVIDARTQRLPNVLVYPTLGVVGLLLAGAAVGTGAWADLARAGMGALALSGVYLVLHLIDARNLGLGDVKLMLVVGMLAGWNSWQLVLWAGAMPFVLGGVCALALLATRRAGRQAMLPFGPFVLIGAATAATLARLVEV